MVLLIQFMVFWYHTDRPYLQRKAVIQFTALSCCKAETKVGIGRVERIRRFRVYQDWCRDLCL